MHNLDLWSSIEKTDPRHTTKISGKNYRGTSPRPYWLIHAATSKFGPCGIGWGFKILEERIEDGAPGDKVHIARVQVWYILADKRGEVEHVGETMFCGKNKNGPYTDEDAPKKSVTDALVKALSMIGFAGDIFMGRFDDSKYVDALAQEFAANGEAGTITDDQATALLGEIEKQGGRTFDAIIKAYWPNGLPESLDNLSRLDVIKKLPADQFADCVQRLNDRRAAAKAKSGEAKP